MEMKFERALWGYREEEVYAMFQEFKIDVKCIVNNYEKEFIRLQEENKRISEEIEQAEKELKEYRSTRSQMETKLYNYFIEACLKIYETEKAFDENIENKNKVLKDQQRVNCRIKSSAGRLLEQMQQIEGRDSHEE